MTAETTFIAEIASIKVKVKRAVRIECATLSLSSPAFFPVDTHCTYGTDRRGGERGDSRKETFDEATTRKQYRRERALLSSWYLNNIACECLNTVSVWLICSWNFPSCVMLEYVDARCSKIEVGSRFVERIESKVPSIIGWPSTSPLRMRIENTHLNQFYVRSFTSTLLSHPLFMPQYCLTSVVVPFPFSNPYLHYRSNFIDCSRCKKFHLQAYKFNLQILHNYGNVLPTAVESTSIIPMQKALNLRLSLKKRGIFLTTSLKKRQSLQYRNINNRIPHLVRRLSSTHTQYHLLNHQSYP